MTDLERAQTLLPFGFLANLDGFTPADVCYMEVQLRQAIETALAAARNEALEEAAHECDEEAKGASGEVAFRDGCETCAAAIRLLKEKL